MIENVKSEVYKLLVYDDSGHDMNHINRVLALSLKFAKYENADEYITALIALLHDVDDYKLFGLENEKYLIAVPGIAFDEKGYRIGYGKGYYDKYFAQTDALLVGVCYDFQICSELPFDEHDLTVDILLPVMTEDYEE